MIVTLQDAKSHLRLSSDHEDEYLSLLVESAEQYVADELCLESVDDLADQPKPVRNAVLFLIAHWFTIRQPVTTDSAFVPKSFPLAYDSLIWKYRRKRFV